jgi:DnaJ-class molecular chaperone
MEKDLTRNGKRLRVKIPARIKSGTRIRLRNARLTTDGFPGDIYITVKVK